MSTQEELHCKLITALTDNGSLRTDPWKRAAGQVPRHEFLRGGYFRRLPGTSPTAWFPVMDDSEDWLPLCYSDESLVTQIAGTIAPRDIQGAILREPSSSSTLPSLVLRMLEELQVEPEDQVLEIGTGTGYSTAVLSARLGDEQVTSVEYDHEVASRARAALAAVDMYPTLVTGDGLLGYPDRAPYDRIIATCAVRTVPAAWIRQTKVRGTILVCVGGWLGASELVRFTVHDNDTASGKFLGGHVSFMLARPHAAPPLGMLPDLSDGKERRAEIGSDILRDWTARFLVQDMLPNAQLLTLQQDDHTENVLIDSITGAWVALRQDADRWIVRQGGPELMWDAVEHRIGQWRTNGSPPLEDCALDLTADGSQTIHW
ncbi:ATP-grasp peptide maturase system methyltransferase [Streptomyces sp. NPDC005209]|uniref:ATP-grasp peptide maturase system methyltransferase n=1 Tax=Streptomyces sp. NPDC005209 TaxID=3156715 RepID=UPI0033BD01C1